MSRHPSDKCQEIRTGQSVTRSRNGWTVPVVDRRGWGSIEKSSLRRSDSMISLAAPVRRDMPSKESCDLMWQRTVAGATTGRPKAIISLTEVREHDESISGWVLCASLAVCLATPRTGGRGRLRGGRRRDRRMGGCSKESGCCCDDDRCDVCGRHANCHKICRLMEGTKEGHQNLLR